MHTELNRNVSNPKSTTSLRPYQQAVVDRLLRVDLRSGIVVAPTGSGKSLIIDALVRSPLYRRPVVIVNELTVKSQLAERLGGTGVPILSPLSFEEGAGYDLIIIDEVHHYRRDRAWGRVLSSTSNDSPDNNAGDAKLHVGAASSPRARIIGFTATPVWAEELSLPLLVRIPYALLREQGFLAPPLTAITIADPTPETVNEALATSLCRHTVFYISQREQYNPEFMGRLIDASTPASLRRFLPTDGGRLCNIATLTTGWDDPDIDSIVLWRRIGSDNPQTYLQIIGRLRRGGVLIDCADNVLRFGLDEDALFESGGLGGRGAPSTPTLAPALKRCLGCQRLLHPRQNVCPYCGYACPAPHRSGKLWRPLSKEEINEWIARLDASRLSALRWKVCPYTKKGLWPIKLPGANITAWVGRGDGVEKWSFIGTMMRTLRDRGVTVWVVPDSTWILVARDGASESERSAASGSVVYARDVSKGADGSWVCVARA